MRRSEALGARHGFFGSTLQGQPFDVGVGSPGRRRGLEAAAAALGLGTIFTLKQVHGVAVAQWVGGVEPRDGVEADAVISDAVAIGVLTADCVPILIDAPRRGLVAAVHAGRVGAIGGILGQTVAAMLRLGAQLDELSLAVGPHIAANSYEVGEAMFAQLPKAGQHRAADGRACCDLLALLRRQVEVLGLEAHQLDVLAVDTRTSPRHHSYRRDGLAAGRQLSVISP